MPKQYVLTLEDVAELTQACRDALNAAPDMAPSMRFTSLLARKGPAIVMALEQLITIANKHPGVHAIEAGVLMALVGPPSVKEVLQDWERNPPDPVELEKIAKYQQRAGVSLEEAKAHYIRWFMQRPDEESVISGSNPDARHYWADRRLARRPRPGDVWTSTSDPPEVRTVQAVSPLTGSVRYELPGGAVQYAEMFDWSFWINSAILTHREQD